MSVFTRIASWGIVALLITTASPLCYGSRPMASTFEELHPRVQQELREWAAQCVLLNDEIWCMEPEENFDRAVSEQMRKLRNNARIVGPADARESEDASLVMRLADGMGAGSLEGAIIHVILDAEDARNLRRERFSVIQVMDGRVLVAEPNRNRNAIVVMATEGIVDGDIVEGHFIRKGTEQYISVLGATRTVPAYEKIDLLATMDFGRVSPEELFQHLLKHDIANRTIRRPRLELESGPQYRTQRRRSGGLVYEQNRQTRGAQYRWQWSSVERPINLLAYTRD